MTLAITIGAAVLVIGLGLLGALRDLLRGILALTGVLFGVALVAFWADPLALYFGRILNNADTALLLRVMSIAIFGTTVLLLGFGSSLLVPTIEGASLATRAAGMALGAFTGALAAGYLLVYATNDNPGLLQQIQQSPVAGLLEARLPLLLAVGAGLIGAAVIIRGVSKLFRRTNQANTRDQATVPSPAKQDIDRRVAEKIRDRTGTG